MNGITQLIIKHFSGETSPEEEKDILKYLNQDPDFKKEFEEYRELIQGIKYNGFKEDFQKIKLLESKADIADIKSRTIRKTFWSIAAVISILIVGSVFLLISGNKNERLFREYFEVYPVIGENITRGNEDVQAGFRYYQQGQYGLAISEFEMLDQEDPFIQYYLGNAYLAIGNSDKAINSFKSITGEDFDLAVQTKWYLSLAYLKQGDLARAKALLSGISEGNTSYSPKAKKILDDL
jgi:tetratricopeptide (TPR) repeat protein